MLASAVSIAYLVLVCAVLPILAWASKRKIDQGVVIPRLPLYFEGLILQTLLLAISAGVAGLAGITLFARTGIAFADVLLVFAILALALTAMMTGWRVAKPEARRRVSILIPVTRAERRLFIVLSLAAGVSEEVAFRGVLPAILERTTGSLWIAFLISATAFALAHLLQGWTSAMFVGIFGLVLHLLVWTTGTLWTAIAVHVLYDVVAGLTLGKIVSPEPEVLDADV